MGTFFPTPPHMKIDWFQVKGGVLGQIVKILHHTLKMAKYIKTLNFTKKDLMTFWILKMFSDISKHLNIELRFCNPSTR